jgi:hypothetical protein
MAGGTLWVIVAVTDQVVPQADLVHLKQRWLPASMCVKTGTKISQRSLSRYLMVKTSAGLLSLHQSKTM